VPLTQGQLTASLAGRKSPFTLRSSNFIAENHRQNLTVPLAFVDADLGKIRLMEGGEDDVSAVARFFSRRGMYWGNSGHAVGIQTESGNSHIHEN
jgi:hypothetical protein